MPEGNYGACTGFTPGLDGFLYREVVSGGSSGGGGAVPPIPETPGTPTTPGTPGVPETPSIPREPIRPSVPVDGFLGQLDRIAITQTSETSFTLNTADNGIPGAYLWTTERLLEDNPVFDGIAAARA